MSDDYKKIIIRGVRHLASIEEKDERSYFRNVHGIFFNPFFIEMSYIPGVTLRQWVNDPHRYNLDTGLDIFREILTATARLHNAKTPIIHRDIRPDNVLITPKNAVKLIDFGFAITAADKKIEVQNVLGNPCYASPEQLENSDLVTEKTTDTYSLGQVLWYIVTGTEKRLGEHNPAELLDYGVENALPGFYSRATLQDPKKRYQTPDEMIRAYNEIYQPFALAKKEEDILGIIENIIIILKGDLYLCEIFLAYFMPAKRVRALWRKVAEERAKICILD